MTPGFFANFYKKIKTITSEDILNLAGRYGALIFLILLSIVFAILEPAFVSTINIFNILRQVSIYGLLGIGMTFVILTGGIDLSVGSLLAVSGLVCAAVEKGGRLLTGAPTGESAGYGLITAIFTAVVIGLIGGILQGLAVSKLKVPPFIVTLGGLSVFRGAALVFSNGQPISAFRESYRFWGQGMVGPIPVPVLIFFVVAVIAFVTLRYTKYGRYIYAVGGNQEGARLSGLNVDKIIASVYIIMGLLAGFSGFLLSSRLNSAEQVAGEGFELTVIAGVVIGGTSLSGGVGTIFGTIIGTILVGVLSNGLTLLNVSSYYQRIVIGLITVFAVYFDQIVKRNRSK